MTKKYQPLIEELEVQETGYMTENQMSHQIIIDGGIQRQQSKQEKDSRGNLHTERNVNTVEEFTSQRTVML